MKHDHILDLLSEYIDGTLSAGDFEKVKTHLIFCSTCRSALAEMKEHVHILKSLRAEKPSPTLETRILAAVSRELQGTVEEPVETVSHAERPRFWSFTFRGTAVLASCVFAFLIVRQYLAKETVADLSKESTVAANSKVQVAAAQNIRPERVDQPAEKKSEIVGTDAEQQKGASRKIEVAALKQGREEDQGYFGERAKLRNLATTRGFSARAVSDKPAAPQTPVLPAKDRLAAKPAVSHEENAGRQMDRVEAMGGKTNQPQVLGSGDKEGADWKTGSFSGISTPQKQVIKDEETWKSLWAQHAKDRMPTTPAPSVDFSRNEVIAIFAGQKPSSGYGISITAVEPTEWNGKPARIVRYHLSAPPAGTVAATVITHPFAFKVVDKITGNTFFRESP